MKPKFDIQLTREKYTALAKKQGSAFAITALAREMGNLEAHVFDGGYEEERLHYLNECRELSRELWTEKYNYDS